MQEVGVKVVVAVEAIQRSIPFALRTPDMKSECILAHIANVVYWSIDRKIYVCVYLNSEPTGIAVEAGLLWDLWMVRGKSVFPDVYFANKNWKIRSASCR